MGAETPERLLQEHQAEAVGLAAQLVCQMLQQPLEDTEEWIDMVQCKMGKIIYFGVFQYCFVRVFMTVVAVVTEAAGRYCLASLHPAFAHIWVMVIEGGCVTIAMYCLIQFYVQLKDDLAEHSPLLKVAAIKLVIFLSFWQTILISFLTSSGAIKPSQRFQGSDLRIGIPSLLLCIEMAIFSIFHLFAFPWQVYDIRRSAIVASESVPGYLPDPKTAYLGGPLGSKALLDAFNPWDLVKAIGRGFRWFAVGRRNREQDVSYQAYKISRPLNPDATDIDGMGNRRDRMPSGPFTPGAISKQGRYHQVKGGPDEDDRRLLSHQQSVPLSSSENVYPRPGMRLPDERDLYDGSSSVHSHARSNHHMPTHTNHMRHPSHLNPSYPTGQNQQIGIHDPNPAFHHQYQEQDISYHGASSSFSHPSPYSSTINNNNNNNNNPADRISLTSTTSDPDDWRDWSGAHGPHNQSDVARLSGEHIAQARLSAEQERRSMQRSRRGSEESGRSSAPERMRAQRLSAIGRPSGESSRSGLSGKRGEEGEGLGVRDEGRERERERSRGKSPSEVWRGMQRGGGAGGEFD
ncbi:MAG: hypothetical protein LQ339_001081 [Xanthoria mediterranea]|nr:MAG: hypothetical protein LQ339_001081 [Xanthoria mediterranea]